METIQLYLTGILHFSVISSILFQQLIRPFHTLNMDSLFPSIKQLIQFILEQLIQTNNAITHYHHKALNVKISQQAQLMQPEIIN